MVRGEVVLAVAMDEIGSPPAPHWMDRPLRVVPAVIAVNVVVWLVWQAARGSEALAVTMVGNFQVSWLHLVHGRPWTLLTSVFSHIDPVHLLINMVVLYSFGAMLERLLRWQRFLVFYLVAGVFASLCHALTSAALLGEPGVRALGASGAVSGMLMVTGLLFPEQRIYIFGVLPVPGLVAVLAFVGIDLLGLIGQSRGLGSSIGHGAHLGGALFGALYYAFYLRHRVHRVRRAPE